MKLMWAKIMFGIEVSDFFNAYRLGSESNKKENEAFCSELSKCVEEGIRRGSHLVVLGDLNARVENEEVLGVTGKYGVPDGISVERDCKRYALRWEW